MGKDISISVAVIAVLAVGAAHFLGNRPHAATDSPAPAEKTSTIPAAPRQAAAPVASPPASGRTVALASDGRGHFKADLEANGVRFQAMVDTGASVVALPQSLAERLGHFPGLNAFTSIVRTANGDVKVAPVVLRELRLAGIEVRDVEAVIVPDSSLREVLLGMSFLRRLRSFSVKDDTLTLVQ
jgi:aspartyl protease family protein